MHTKLLFAIFFLASGVVAQEAPVLNQKPVGKNACGPCAYINSLLQSKDERLLGSLEGESPADKARNFGRIFGLKPSIYPGKPETAYSDQDGVSDRDLLTMVNQMRAASDQKAVSGEYLLRRENETPKVFLRRIGKGISDSIDSGFCPLLDIRCSKVVLEPDGVIRWNKIAGHWVCVVSAQSVSDDMLLLRVADSYTGKMANLIIHCDIPNRAVVPISFSYTDKGKVKWNWEQSDRCLFVCAPSLFVGRGKISWFERNYLAACYLIRK